MEIKLGDEFEDKEGHIYELIEYSSCEIDCLWLRDVNNNEAGWMHYRNLEEANKYINNNIDLGELKPIKPSTDYDKMLKIKELLEELEIPQDKIDRMIEVFCEGTHIHVINYNSNHKLNSNIPVNPFAHTFEINQYDPYVTRSEVQEMIYRALNNK